MLPIRRPRAHSRHRSRRVSWHLRPSEDDPCQQSGVLPAIPVWLGNHNICCDYRHWYKNDNDLCLFDNSITLHNREIAGDGHLPERLAWRIQFDFDKFVDYNPDIEKMFYYSEDDLGDKIKYFLKYEEEREEIAKRVYDYIFQNHTYENRAQLILDNVSQYLN